MWRFGIACEVTGARSIAAKWGQSFTDVPVSIKDVNVQTLCENQAIFTTE